MEYKFRGKNKDIGWVYGQLVYDVKENAYIVQNVEQDSSYGLEETMLCATMWYRVDKETVGQYAGLHDKNGKEIYEGDIVKVKHLNAIYVGTVKFDKEYCEYRIELVDAYINLWKKLENIEVIGNTTDNLELLKEE